jgi:hypothetical protein
MAEATDVSTDLTFLVLRGRYLIVLLPPTLCLMASVTRFQQFINALLVDLFKTQLSWSAVEIDIIATYHAWIVEAIRLKMATLIQQLRSQLHDLLNPLLSPMTTLAVAELC